MKNKITTAVALALLVALTSCGATAKKVETSIASGVSKGLACEKTDLTQMVSGGPLLTVIAIDVASGNYLDLIASLIGKIGSDAVGCAVLAVQDVFNAAKGTGTAPTPTPAPMPVPVTPAIASASASTIEHINALKATYGWERAVTPPPTATKL